MTRKFVYHFRLMKQLLFFFLLISIATNSQDFKKVDSLVLEYPRFSKVDDLATRISKDFTSDKDKARAAFYWLAKNIHYNLREYYNPKQRSYHFSYATEKEKKQKLQALKNKIIDAAFISKKGVCEEYAQSFKKVCDLLGLESEVIKGTVRLHPEEIGKPNGNTNHAWNAVKLNNKWVLLDVTWAAGYVMNGKWVQKFNNYFYDIPKNKIFKTHFPTETIWALRFGNITLEAFYNQPIYGASFLNSKIELISPITGILKVNSSNEVQLNFKNLAKTSLINYTFKGQRFAKKPIITTLGNTTTLTFKEAKKNSSLRIFINKELALQFKTK